MSIQGFYQDKATETINAANARYGYKPEFHEIYAQVGAVIASESNISFVYRLVIKAVI